MISIRNRFLAAAGGGAIRRVVHDQLVPRWRIIRLSTLSASGHFNADRVISIGTGGRADIKHDMLIKILMRADYLNSLARKRENRKLICPQVFGLNYLIGMS